MGHLEIVQLLLDHGAGANAQNERCKTGLHLVAQNGHLQIVEVSLERWADPQARTDKGETPFQVVASKSQKNRAQIKRLLLERTGESTEDVDVEMRD